MASRPAAKPSGVSRTWEGRGAGPWENPPASPRGGGRGGWAAGRARRRSAEVVDRELHADGEAPAPPLARGVLLGVSRDRDLGEDDLPSRGVQQRTVPALDRGAAARAVPPDRAAVDRRGQRPRRRAADEQPARAAQRDRLRSERKAIAIATSPMTWPS